MKILSDYTDHSVDINKQPKQDDSTDDGLMQLCLKTV